jgi:hypothetical protein
VMAVLVIPVAKCWITSNDWDVLTHQSLSMFKLKHNSDFFSFTGKFSLSFIDILLNHFNLVLAKTQINYLLDSFCMSCDVSRCLPCWFTMI